MGKYSVWHQVLKLFTVLVSITMGFELLSNLHLLR
ncbi:hypothetical protein Gotri_027058 [Gossypium trilobum]|uniref:Uncharacterized protein n=1 Tax=Gossypium trilobum TaxID=34281 RepID=A0A7J9FNU7_9ROSI|nr:hypothetical protein [Gossypium trilobum]